MDSHDYKTKTKQPKHIAFPKRKTLPDLQPLEHRNFMFSFDLFEKIQNIQNSNYSGKPLFKHRFYPDTRLLRTIKDNLVSTDEKFLA